MDGLPTSGMNYFLIHGIKIYFLLLHCYEILVISKTYILHIIILHNTLYHIIILLYIYYIILYYKLYIELLDV